MRAQASGEPSGEMMAPAISVVMSVYNGQPYVSQTIDGVLRQTFGDFEFLILDDGSTDNTWETLSTYAAQDRRVTLLRNEKNIGITRSMNRLFPLARGTYLTRHDADDVSAPERFARQVAFLRTNPSVGVVGTRVEIINADGAPLDIALFPPVLDDGAIQQALLAGNCLCQGSVMFRRVCLEAVGYYDESLEPTEDYDLWLRLAEVTQMASLDTPLYRYRYHPHSISKRRHRLQLLQLAEALEKAVYRRDGPAPSAERLALVAHRYLRSSLAILAAGDLPLARRCLERALALAPALLSADQPLAGLLTEQVGGLAAEEALAACHGIFAELLPPAAARLRRARLARLKARLTSQLHMREVFAGVRQGQRRRVQAHLWPGLRQDPTWLMNRGVVAILVRTLLQRGP